MEITLNKLTENGLKYNTAKDLFDQTETEFLGFWVTCQSTKQITSKVKAITNIKSPMDKCILQKFLDLI